MQNKQKKNINVYIWIFLHEKILLVNNNKQHNLPLTYTYTNLKPIDWTWWDVIKKQLMLMEEID